MTSNNINIKFASHILCLIVDAAVNNLAAESQSNNLIPVGYHRVLIGIPFLCPEGENEPGSGERNETSDVETNEAEQSNEKNSEVLGLRHQILTLTTSLSTVTEEKSKIVATYQAERKKMKVRLTLILQK